MDKTEQNKAIQQFLNQEFDWRLTAGECNFLIQLLAHVVQENPAIVPEAKNPGAKQPLNYQSIRTVVLLNEKLSAQLQQRANERSVVMGEGSVPSDQVQ